VFQIASRYRRSVTVRGVLAVLFGLTALIWPAMTLLTLVLLFGAYALVDGVIALSVAMSRERPAQGRGWFVAEGIVGVVTGIATFAWPGATALVLLWLIAGWALVLGVLKVAAAVRLRHAIQGAWLLGVSGIISVLFAAMLAARPASGALAVVVVIAVYAIASGAALIGLGVRMRRVSEAPSRPGVSHAVSS
jgi:uncharacterized membrane protein HdeD (DUF308 family)